MRNLNSLALFALANGYKQFTKVEPKPTRPCLYCKTPHSHNNSFCSAECNKQYKADKRQ